MQETSVSGKGSVPSSNASPQEARQRHGSRAAENVQRALLTDIAPLLPGFVAACDMGQMLYITPLLVTTLCHYPEELSIQLQLVETMHRIIHLPLSCWSDALTSDEAQEQALLSKKGEVEQVISKLQEKVDELEVHVENAYEFVATPINPLFLNLFPLLACSHLY